MHTVSDVSIAQLKKLHSGKVRESFAIDEKRRMIVVTDRLSAFDQVLGSCIPHKGAVLNSLSNYWFNETSDIVENHLLKQIDPSISIVKEVTPLKVEVIVRGYLTGSMWRAYKNGKRNFSGIAVEDGLTQHQSFSTPLLTPTTKDVHDEEITPQGIVEQGLATQDQWQQMATAAMQLFERGTTILKEKGLILVDTKYEFGLFNEKIILIDEIHTADSSRIWDAEQYEKDPLAVESMDKEFVRAYLLSQKKAGNEVSSLPQDVVDETSKRYQELYTKVTGETIEPYEHPKQRMLHNLVNHKLIKEGYVAIVMGSPADQEYAETIKKEVEAFGIHVHMRIVSAHKNGERMPELMERYNNSIEPGVIIAVAGLSNGLGGALAANMNIPVINCPPFKSDTDLMLNLQSSIMMPSAVPAMTVVKPKLAAQAAMRCIQSYSLRECFSETIDAMKQSLQKKDQELFPLG